MKDAVIILFLAIIAAIIFSRSTSSATPEPAKCNTKLVDKNTVCSKIWAKFPNDGPRSSDGRKKYCCQ